MTIGTLVSSIVFKTRTESVVLDIIVGAGVQGSPWLPERLEGIYIDFQNNIIDIAYII